jgi:hypothetical protein
LDDRLPDLSEVHRLGLAFDLVLLSGVWMHLPPPLRQRAFRKLATLLKPGGLMVLTLREGAFEDGRPSWPVSMSEIESLARDHGLAVIKSEASPDELGRSAVTWRSMCLRLPDDGAGALPLLRGIIFNDDKSSTYKLGLLRAVARIADTASPTARETPGDVDAYDVPLGLVALNWVRAYLPLVTASLPQLPGNRGAEGLGFAKEGFRALARLGVSAQDLRIGAYFTGDRAAAVIQALGEARRTIVDMPAHYTRYPNSDRAVFDTNPARVKSSPTVCLDVETLAAFGTLTVPGLIWRSMQRLGAWIEPVLLAEWARLIRGYAERMAEPLAPGIVEEKLVWLDPTRDTQLARAVARRILEEDGELICTWSGARLREESLDIDHCLPWSAWPCGDLWNLFPSSRRVNQTLKRDRLPSSAMLVLARSRIEGWWERAWSSDAGLVGRFRREAEAALAVGSDATPGELFSGLEWRRLRLQQDQQLPEWAVL